MMLCACEGIYSRKASCRQNILIVVSENRFLFINCTALSAEPPLLSRRRPFFKASRVSASAHEKYIFVTYNKTTHFLPL